MTQCVVAAVRRQWLFDKVTCKWSVMRFADGRAVRKQLSPGHKADFVKSIRSRYKNKADQILKCVMKTANEYVNSSDQVTGYSQAFIPFDNEKCEDMTPEQRVAFLLRHLGAESDLISKTLAPPCAV